MATKGNNNREKPGVIALILLMALISITMFSSVIIIMKNKEHISKHLAP